eukprot:6984508-Prymnesium_polylepis.1
MSADLAFEVPFDRWLEEDASRQYLTDTLIYYVGIPVASAVVLSLAVLACGCYQRCKRGKGQPPVASRLSVCAAVAAFVALAWTGYALSRTMYAADSIPGLID